MGDTMNNDDVKKMLNLENVGDYKLWQKYLRADNNFLWWLSILTGLLIICCACLGQVLQLTISLPLVVEETTMGFNNQTILVNQTFADGMADISRATMQTVLTPMFFAILTAVGAMVAAAGMQNCIRDITDIESMLVERKRCKK